MDLNRSSKMIKEQALETARSILSKILVRSSSSNHENKERTETQAAQAQRTSAVFARAGAANQSEHKAAWHCTPGRLSRPLKEAARSWCVQAAQIREAKREQKRRPPRRGGHQLSRPIRRRESVRTQSSLALYAWPLLTAFERGCARALPPLLLPWRSGRPGGWRPALGTSDA